MARKTTLVRLLEMLRHEERLSKNLAHNAQVRDSHVNMLQRVQDRLFDDFTWPHLRVERQVAVQSGQRLYEPPTDMQIDNIERIDVFLDGHWCRVEPTLGSGDFQVYNSDLDQRSWPPRKWRIYEDEQIEIWPIADQNGDAATRDGYLKFTGIRNLKPLVDDGDRADLDDRMLTLYAAAELLAKDNAADAKLKQDSADRIYGKLRSGLMPRRRFRMFGLGEPPPTNRMFAHWRPQEDA